MAINYFVSEDKNLNNIYKKLILWFEERQYLVDAVENGDEYLIQAKKIDTFRTLTGTNQAFKTKIYWSDNLENANKFVLETSTGQWISNLAVVGVTAMFTGGFTVLTGLAGLAIAGWALVVENNLIDYVENTLHCRKIKEESIASISQSRNPTNANIVQPQNNDLVDLPRAKAEEKAKQELDRLLKAYQEGILEKEEFEFKKANLESQIEKYEIDFTVEEKILKLEQAFAQGILNKEEYESKVSKIRSTVEKQIGRRKFEEENLCRMIKLKQALESGILTQVEYEAKIAGLKTNIGILKI